MDAAALGVAAAEAAMVEALDVAMEDSSAGGTVAVAAEGVAGPASATKNKSRSSSSILLCCLIFNFQTVPNMMLLFPKNMVTSVSVCYFPTTSSGFFRRNTHMYLLI